MGVGPTGKLSCSRCLRACGLSSQRGSRGTLEVYSPGSNRLISNGPQWAAMGQVYIRRGEKLPRFGSLEGFCFPSIPQTVRNLDLTIRTLLPFSTVVPSHSRTGCNWNGSTLDERKAGMFPCPQRKSL
jgi:hypothetical protein